VMIESQKLCFLSRNLSNKTIEKRDLYPNTISESRTMFPTKPCRNENGAFSLKLCVHAYEVDSLCIVHAQVQCYWNYDEVFDLFGVEFLHGDRYGSICILLYVDIQVPISFLLRPLLQSRPNTPPIPSSEKVKSIIGSKAWYIQLRYISHFAYQFVVG
ncbi:hypothetical protein STEG23_011236, partial [Scotinomys teguina]